MRITFRRFPDRSNAYSVIERDDGVVYRMKEFTRAGTELPHDLRHFVVERELGIADGIWGGIAAGMVYASMDHMRGRRPPHSAERSDQLMRAQRQPLRRAELLANLVEAIAMLDDPSAEKIGRLAKAKLSAVPVAEPGVDAATVVALPSTEALAAAARALQAEASCWARLKPGEELVYQWRQTVPSSVHALRIMRPRDAGDRRGPHRTGRRGSRKRTVLRAMISTASSSEPPQLPPDHHLHTGSVLVPGRHDVTGWHGGREFSLMVRAGSAVADAGRPGHELG
jgi:hypothetical protein